MALVDPAISLLAFCCCRRRRQSRCQQSSALLMKVPITLALIFREALTAAFKAPLHAPCTRRLSHCTHLTYIWGICFLKSSDSGRIENHNGVSGSCINAPVHHNFNAAVAPGATCKSALSDHDCNKWAALLYCEPWSKFRPFMNDKCYAACEFYHMQPW